MEAFISTSLTPVISVDSEKCVNCHRCIAVCPSKFCNNGSSDYVKINHDLCIGCGACISACKHGARVGIDDFDSFMFDVKKTEFEEKNLGDDYNVTMKSLSEYFERNNIDLSKYSKTTYDNPPSF